MKKFFINTIDKLWQAVEAFANAHPFLFCLLLAAGDSNDRTTQAMLRQMQQNNLMTQMINEQNIQMMNQQNEQMMQMMNQQIINEQNMQSHMSFANDLAWMSTTFVDQGGFIPNPMF